MNLKANEQMKIIRGKSPMNLCLFIFIFFDKFDVVSNSQSLRLRVDEMMRATDQEKKRSGTNSIGAFRSIRKLHRRERTNE